MDEKTKKLLKELADRYETASFIEGDPSKFMHLFDDPADKEAAAFIASSLSFGNRAQFLGKIELILDLAAGNPERWIRTGAFEKDFAPGDTGRFYRFFTRADMNSFFRAYRSIILEHGSLGGFVARNCSGDALEAVEAICKRFREEGSRRVIPKDISSACKRVCMFLRWMTRSGSSVDIGIWSGFIDRKTLIVPLDTHVLAEAAKLGLAGGKTSSMSAALKLTAALAEVFPDDPARGDFALFGRGVANRS